MTHPAFVSPRPTAVIHRYNTRWAFHRVIEPLVAPVPHFEVVK